MPRAFAQTLKMPKVDLDYDKDVDFSAFKTYSWKDPAAAAKDPQMHTRIVWYVERELEKKGLAKKPEGEGDLFVRYYAKGREGFKGTGTQERVVLGRRRRPAHDQRRLPEGPRGHPASSSCSARRTSKAVWRAGSGWGSIDKKRIDADTARAVRLLLSKYPPPSP